MQLSWKKNLGSFDRAARVAIGLYLLGLVFTTNAVVGIWAAIAVIFALFQFVEAYLAY